MHPLPLSKLRKGTELIRSLRLLYLRQGHSLPATHTTGVVVALLLPAEEQRKVLRNSVGKRRNSVQIAHNAC